MSLRQFQRAYCHACFDAVFIERRNFDMKVQNQKTILTADRTVVQSQGERVIADWLHAHAIECRYDDKFQIIQGFAVRPDFYLPRYDLYIEYWGLDTTDYRIGMLLKQKLYQQEGKRLVSLYPRDLPSLDAKLSAALLPAPERRQPGPPPPIRPARPEDLEAINAIYNHYVAASACTYQEEPETMEGRRAWFGRHGAAHPVIVAETDGCVVGWGSLSPYHARSAYRHTVEDSVYVADTCRGRGVGKALLHELVLRARALGHRAIIAQIDGGQAASIALHARFGFEQVGRLSQVGFKFGRWLDVVIMELLLVKEGVQDDHTG